MLRNVQLFCSHVDMASKIKISTDINVQQDIKVFSTAIKGQRYAIRNENSKCLTATSLIGCLSNVYRFAFLPGDRSQQKSGTVRRFTA